MLYSILLGATLALGASLVSAAPLALRQSDALNVVYWGQNGGGTIENNDLSAYCTSSSGIDVLVLAFLYEYGNVSISSAAINEIFC